MTTEQDDMGSKTFKAFSLCVLVCCVVILVILMVKVVHTISTYGTGGGASDETVTKATDTKATDTKGGKTSDLPTISPAAAAHYTREYLVECVAYILTESLDESNKVDQTSVKLAKELAHQTSELNDFLAARPNLSSEITAGPAWRRFVKAVEDLENSYTAYGYIDQADTVSHFTDSIHPAYKALMNEVHKK